MKTALALLLLVSFSLGQTSKTTAKKQKPAPAQPANPEYQLAAEPVLSTERVFGDLEVVATFEGPMPTGVAVSHSGRIFVNFPKWGDKVDYTVAEVIDGKTVPYPNAEVNKTEKKKPQDALISVQSVVIDPQDHLWILDTGSPLFQRPQAGAAKMIEVDLNTNQIIKSIIFPRDVVLPTTYLNDVRFDLHRGKAGMAFITDSSSNGPNAIIVVDLDSGQSWRRLNDHPSTKADPHFQPFVEGEPMLLRLPHQKPKKQLFGADGIAISPDGRILYYCPLSSRDLFAVSVDDLADQQVTENEVSGAVRDLQEKGASDGMETDAEGRVYYGDYENDSIRRRNPDGTYDLIAHDPRIQWPDTLALTDGYLYFTANQLQRQPNFHDGKDLRQKPYVLFRIKVDAHRLK
jgi:sugar lactone lactonase YvrE